ncbi:MAG: rhodanese-like domain-containing protein [Thiotrichales bacterium]
MDQQSKQGPPVLESMTPQEAHAFITAQSPVAFIDVRSSMEYLFVGHPSGATHIAWIDEPDWEVNEGFAAEVLANCQSLSDTEPRAVPVVLICRSGKRSMEAGTALLEAGFKQVINVSEGFEGERDEHFHRSSVGGWRFRDLPWEQC